MCVYVCLCVRSVVNYHCIQERQQVLCQVTLSTSDMASHASCSQSLSTISTGKPQQLLRRSAHITLGYLHITVLLPPVQGLRQSNSWLLVCLLTCSTAHHEIISSMRAKIMHCAQDGIPSNCHLVGSKAKQLVTPC